VLIIAFIFAIVSSCCMCICLNELFCGPINKSVFWFAFTLFFMSILIISLAIMHKILIWGAI
jgi:hypothetical protein